MDAFKTAEVRRMELGGNKAWRAFYNKNSDIEWEEATKKERYGGTVGGEYKERLTCKVEGRQYVPGVLSAQTASNTASSSNSKQPSRTATPASGAGAINASTSYSNGNPTSFPIASSTAGNPPQKARNEAYFAKLGAENASRSGEVPPSQGGKFQGFGSELGADAGAKGGTGATIDDFAKDSIATLSKGFGWFASTVTKTAKSAHEGIVQPTAQRLAQGDLAAQARTVAQQGTKSLADGFNRLVEGPDSTQSHSGQRAVKPEKADFWDSFGAAPKGPDRDKQGFWDSFGKPEMAAPTKPSALGTSAMKGVPGGSVPSAGSHDKTEEGWKDDKWEEF